MNPILQRMSNNQRGNNIFQQFNDFKRMIGNRDPEAIINDLLASGRMSQNQFNELKKKAIEMQSVLK